MVHLLLLLTVVKLTFKNSSFLLTLQGKTHKRVRPAWVDLTWELAHFCWPFLLGSRKWPCLLAIMMLRPRQQQKATTIRRTSKICCVLFALSLLLLRLVAAAATKCGRQLWINCKFCVCHTGQIAGKKKRETRSRQSKRYRILVSVSVHSLSLSLTLLSSHSDVASTILLGYL